MKLTGVFICCVIMIGATSVAFPVPQNLATEIRSVVREFMSLNSTCQMYIQQLHTVLTESEVNSSTNERIPVLQDQVTSLTGINRLTQILRRTELNITLLINAAEMLDRSHILNMTSFAALISDMGNLKTIISNLRRSVEESFTVEQIDLERDVKLVDYMLYFEADDQLHETEFRTDSKGTNLDELVIIGRLKEQLISLVPRLISYLS